MSSQILLLHINKIGIVAIGTERPMHKAMGSAFQCFKNIYNKNPVKKSLKFEVKICPKGKSLSVFVPNSLELKYFCIKIAMKKKFQKDKNPPKKIQRKNVLFAIVHRAARKRSPNRSMSKKIIF